ncbi:putative transcription regulator mTERF family [Helianthus annuus]|nr:putative transcription regulator mTERF family [Helianthus annuus]KAJ0759184.1 putative transcription regulator mTERF family [Helianthus annuus]KAJ0762835.1 putative transcription regulator mTERF family [Helianthus annuus]
MVLFNFIYRSISTHARKRCYGLLSSSSPFSTTTSAHSSNPNTFTTTYLINSCGVSPESALLASKRLDLSKSPKTADSVLTLLKNHGFTKSQVSKVILSCPKILLCDLENTLLPNFKILNSLGFSNAELVTIVTSRPRSIMQGKFHDTALLSVSFLRTVLGSDDKVINAIKRFPQVLTYDLQVYGAENIQLLLEIGVPELRIKSMLAQQPRTFFTSADRFKTVVGNVTKMGIDPSKARFLWAIHAFRAMSKSTWDKKVELYMKWGWSKDEILLAFERNPGCMMASMDKITRILDFLVNTMGWDKSYIIQSPIIVCYSIEKRIIPRCLVYKYLAEKGLTGDIEDFCFTQSQWLTYSEKLFLKWVVKKYEAEAPELLKLYEKHMNVANGL